MSDPKQVITKILEICEDDIFLASNSRFYDPVDWDFYSDIILEVWKTAFQDYQAQDISCTFQDYFLECLTQKMVDDEIIPSLFELASAIHDKNSEALLKNETLTDEVFDAIEAMDSSKITSIIEDELVRLETDTALDSHNLKHKKFKMIYNPFFDNLDDSSIFGSEPSLMNVDDNLVNAMRFFKQNLSDMNQEFVKRGYKSSEEWEESKRVKFSGNKVVSLELLTTIFENSYRYNIPTLFFSVDFSTLCSLEPDKVMSIRGGSLGMVDFINGSGHAESMEDNCSVSIKLDRATDFFDCGSSEKGKFIDRCWCPSFAFFKSDTVVA